ncbi:uroporphyrinogen-III synthase [Govanella unica]|uniref:Uroporphyrinogen-III synthase n=1 Tax=Govanella unica TaxID=2975056 RepID=A0A9X3Z7Q1_9PROT|nr:uroporphyrinogen-III synthase [Govania unica]MDA5194475.1 uroporphyrinogen-III synthase [Govania unica]
MHILVTRPAEDAAALTRTLEAAGHRVTLAPMMIIRPEPVTTINLEGCQALVFTSANGVRAFAAISADRALPVIAVGDATARTARAAGFTQIDTAAGEVHSLAALIIDTRDPAKGPLFHAAGHIVAGDLGGLLQPHGFTLRRQVLYRAEAVTALPAPAIKALDHDQPDIALFYSPRTARIFMDLVDTAGRLNRLQNITAGALSEAVTKALESGSWPLQSPLWHRIVTAAEPAEVALLGALDLLTSKGDFDT